MGRPQMTSLATRWREAPLRSRGALAVSRSPLLALPLVADSYLLSVAILALYLAYVGQAWNIMMGFAGQLSLGHSLYVGLGAYAAAALFSALRRRRPGSACWLAIGVCVLAGAGHRLAGVSLRHLGHLLRAADHRLRRVHAHRLRPLRLARRLGRPVPAGRTGRHARPGSTSAARPLMFYYVALALAARRASGCAAWLLRSRAGYYWRAIRENEDAAQRARHRHCSAARCCAVQFSARR